MRVFGSDLEPAVIFHHRVGKIDPFSAPNELPQFWATVHPNVVAHKVAVDAVPPSLLLVQDDVGSCRQETIFFFFFLSIAIVLITLCEKPQIEAVVC